MSEPLDTIGPGPARDDEGHGIAAASTAGVDAPSCAPNGVAGISSPSNEVFATHLRTYEGPLDLLLYLIHKNEIDIFDIPIATIIEQYLAHMPDWQRRGELSLSAAGEFVMMAARLMEIKSRLLLPNEPSDEDDDALEVEIEDPRQSLVQQLLEYKETKERAFALEEILARHSLKYDRPTHDLPPPPPDMLDLSSTTLIDLTAALQRVLAEAEARERVAVIEVEDVPIERLIQEISERLKASVEPMRFSTLFDPALGVRVLIGHFLAVLEMAKLRLIELSQDVQYGEIVLRPQAGRTDVVSGTTEDPEPLS